MCRKNNDPHKLSVSSLTTIGAIFLGLYLFFASLLESLGIEIIWFNSRTFSMVSAMYPGLIIATVPGAFLALVVGIICGGLCFGVFGLLYNILIDKCRYAKGY